MLEVEAKERSAEVGRKRGMVQPRAGGRFLPNARPSDGRTAERRKVESAEVAGRMMKRLKAGDLTMTG